MGGRSWEAWNEVTRTKVRGLNYGGKNDHLRHSLASAGQLKEKGILLDAISTLQVGS